VEGERPSTTGVYGQNQQWNENRVEVVSLMQQFRTNGYQVVGGGKVYHHADWVNPDPGFSNFLPFRDSGAPAAPDRMQVGDHCYGPVKFEESQMADHALVSFLGAAAAARGRHPVPDGRGAFSSAPTVVDSPALF
jgi:hypothetical protein